MNGSLPKGTSTLRPLEGAMGTPLEDAVSRSLFSGNYGYIWNLRRFIPKGTSTLASSRDVPIVPSRGRSVSFPILRELWLHM